LEFNVPFQHKCGYIRDDADMKKLRHCHPMYSSPSVLHIVYILG